jgi:hypothetical protein
MRSLVASLIVLAFALEARAGDPLAAFLHDVDARAKKDMQAFHATVAAQFGVPEVQVRAVFGRVHDAADTFMVFQIGNMTQRPVNEVLPVYESHKGKGWGAIAKELGIKPGSAEFHALKNGDLHYGSDDSGPGKSHGHGHGPGHRKGGKPN